MSDRIVKVNSLIRKIASAFVSEQIDRDVLVTVTQVNTAKDLKRATIFITVFPEGKESEILALLKKSEWDMKEYAKPRLEMKFLPNFEFEIDYGAKNEQRVEEILEQV